MSSGGLVGRLWKSDPAQSCHGDGCWTPVRKRVSLENVIGNIFPKRVSMAKLASTNLKQFGLVLSGKGLHEKLNREKAPAFADTPCTQSAANFLRGRFFFRGRGALSRHPGIFVAFAFWYAFICSSQGLITFGNCQAWSRSRQCFANDFSGRKFYGGALAVAFRKIWDEVKDKNFMSVQCSVYTGCSYASRSAANPNITN